MPPSPLFALLVISALSCARERKDDPIVTRSKRQWARNPPRACRRLRGFERVSPLRRYSSPLSLTMPLTARPRRCFCPGLPKGSRWMRAGCARSFRPSQAYMPRV